MKKVCFLTSLLFILLFKTSFIYGQEVVVSINPHAVLNDDFTQVKGGYIGERYDPNSLIDLTNPNLINSLKLVIPQDADPPMLIMTAYYLMYPGSPVLTDESVKSLIRLCKEVNCDPIFSPFAGQPPPFSDTSQMRSRIRLINEECQRVFGDDKHCLNWALGGEPTTTPDSCIKWADLIHKSGIILREIIPNAKIHGLELFEYAAKVRGTEEAVGECIIRNLDTKTPKLKIDYLKTHWYPYLGELDVKNRTFTDGNKVLSWKGDSLSPRLRNMLYPYDVVRDMKAWAQKYEVSKDAEIGIGEVLPWAAGHQYGMIYQDDDIPKGCCWLKQNYQSSLTLIGGCDPCLYQTTAEIPSNCKNQCNIPANFPTRRTHVNWGGAFWFLDELGIIAEAGIKNVQVHTFVRALIGGEGGLEVPAHSYNFYNEYFGNTIVEGSSSQPAVLNSHASLDKDGNLRVILINKSIKGEAQTVQINISGYKAEAKGEVYILNVPGADFNSEVKTVQIRTESDVPVGLSFAYEVKGHSAVIIKIPGEVLCQWGSNEQGDGNGDGQTDTKDKDQWKIDFTKSLCKTKGCWQSDFNHDKMVCLSDLEIWRRRTH